MTVTLGDGTVYSVGDSKKSFSIQSISKVFTFTLALDIYSQALYKRVGVEPSGNAFNSLIQLEYENGIPRNPFINAGAIVVTDSLISHYEDEYKTLEVIMNFIREISANPQLSFDPRVANSEMEHGDRNLALARFMKSLDGCQIYYQDWTLYLFICYNPVKVQQVVAGSIMLREESPGCK